MENQYSRTYLLLGKEKVDKLFNKRVAIFGLGGVGGSALESLARFGIGNFDLIDDDVFSLSNLNRQILSLHSTLKKAKVVVAKERVKDINPSINVNTYKKFYLPNNKDEFNFLNYDYIIDCIDTVTAKIDIICEAKRLNIKVISAMGCGNRLDPTKLVITDIYKTSNDPLSKVMRHELRKRNIKDLKVVYSTEAPTKVIEQERETPLDSIEDSTCHKIKKNAPGSTTFVPEAAGILIGYQVAKDLLG